MDKLLFHEMLSIENTRHYVIELSVHIEEMVSETLGELLNIDWKNSQSLGFTSSAISFNHKIGLIQDLKGLEKSQKEKLDTFMYIRNKFAHVKLIDSFEELINNTSNNKLKTLEKWYLKKSKFEDREKNLKHYFYLLFGDIISILFDLRVQTVYQKALDKSEKKINDEFLSTLKDEIKKSHEANEIFNNVLRKIKET